MTNLEKDFPRGGKPRRKPKLRDDGETDGERNLFQITKDKKKERRRKTDEDFMLEPAGPPSKERKLDDDNLLVSDVQPLSSDLLTDPFKVLAVVTDVQEHQLLLSLPAGFVGSVSLTNISDPFSKNLQEYMSQKEDKNLSFPSLSEMFAVGTLVTAHIMETIQKDEKNKSIFLSLNPKQVNNLLHAQDLQAGMVLPAAVISHEDHGYVMDVGIKNLHAFLRNEDAEKFIRKRNKGQSLQVGRVLPCAVKIPDSFEGRSAHSILLHADPKKIAKAVVQDDTLVNLRNLLPGMQVAAKVTKVCPNGLCVSLGELQGLVYKFHLRNVWDAPFKFSVGDTVIGLVLFVHPLLKMFYMNLQTHLDLGFPKDLFSEMRRGEVLQEAVVTEIENNIVHFKLANNHHAVCAFKRELERKKNFRQLSKQFEIGSTYKCRVVKFSRLDNVVIVTTNPETLKETQVSYENLKPGETVECTIKSFPKAGIEVQMGRGVTGFIPYLQTADYPLQEPEKKFRLDQKLTCKVVTVDPAQHKLILTNKRTLVKSALPPLTSYADARPGLLLQGIVVKILNSSLLLIFYNDIKGILDASSLQHIGISEPSKNFYIGQVVTCQVIKCFPESQKLYLALRDFRALEDTLFDKVEIGKLYECEVTDVSPEGLIVKIDEDKKARIPMMHFSDHSHHCTHLLSTYREGDIISEAVGFLNLIENVVSLKPSLLAAARCGEFPFMPETLEIGKCVPCVVLPPSKKGSVTFVQLPGGAIASVLKKHYPNITDETDLMPGLSLLGKVKEITHSPYLKIHVDASLSICFKGDTSPSVQLLESFLHEQERIQQFYKNRDGPKKNVSSMHVGDIVKFAVARQTKLGLIGSIENGVQAVCPTEFSKGVDCKIGSTIVALVLYVDLASNCVEIDLRPRSVKYVQKEKKRSSQLIVGQELNAEALHINYDYVLMMLKGHAWGHLAYIPTRKHLNDIVGTKDLYTIGETYQVEIKSTGPERTIAVLNAHEHMLSVNAKHKNRKKSLPEDGSSFEIGKVYTATIKSVATNHLDVMLHGGVAGRVFITDLVDDIENGQNPLASFHPGHSVRVCIIATRLLKSSSYLPISRSTNRLTVDCSLKPSVVNGTTKHSSEMKLHEGQKVLGFVKQVTHSQVVLNLSATSTGIVDILNTSVNPKNIKEHPNWLKVGGGFHATVVCVNQDEVQLTMTDTMAVEVGNLINAWTVSWRPGIGALLRLPFGYRGTLCITDLADQYEHSARQLQKLTHDQIVRVAIITVDEETKMASLSLRKSRLQPDMSHSIVDPEVMGVSIGLVTRGFVKAVSAKHSRTLVILGHHIGGYIPWPMSKVSAMYPVSVLSAGSVVTVKVKNICDALQSDIELELVDSKSQTDSLQSTPHIDAAMTTDTKHNPVRKRRRRSSASLSLSEDLSQNFQQIEATEFTEMIISATSSRKRRKKLSMSFSEDEVYGKEGHLILLSPVTPNTTVDFLKETVTEKVTSHPENRSLGPKDEDEVIKTKATSISDSLLDKSPVIRDQLEPSLPCLEVDSPFRWDETVKEESTDSGLSSDEDTQSSVVKERTILSVDIPKKEKHKAKVSTEVKLQPPQSADELNRLVLASPNSSSAWLKNIAFFLDNGEVDRARAIAEKALKIIHYREERERLNVWVGMLNLENLHGTEESLDNVLQRALQNCDPLKVHRQMANIYSRSNKLELAEQTYNVMVKKFNTEQEAWLAFLLFLMEHSRLESARSTLQRSLRSLPERHHVDMVSRMAQLEYRYGEPERGRTMFESTLVNYPKRTDLWSVYIDMEVKADDIDSARRILERVTTMSLGVKQMKFFFKKFLDLEKRFGDEASQAHVKTKALEYVELRTASTAEVAT